MSANSKEAVRLCEHIVRQAFGEVVCRVASTLMNRGRLTIPNIARLSGVARPTAVAAVLILMQHQLVQCSGEPAETTKEEAYQFNLDECLLRLRWGRILALTQAKLGFIAVEVVKMLMLHGRLRKDEIVHACGSAGDPTQAREIQDATIQLVQHLYVLPTSSELSCIEEDSIDRRYHAKRKELQAAKGAANVTANDLTEARNHASNDEQDLRHSCRDMEHVLIRTEKLGKRKKKDREEGYEYSLKPDVYLAINYDRYGILMRNEVIVKAAEDRWNKAAAVVMRAVLEASVEDDSLLRETRTTKNVQAAEVIERIPRDAHPMLRAGIAGAQKWPEETIVRQYLRILSGEDQVPGENVFLSMDGSSSNPIYNVELEKICSRLRGSMLSELVRVKLGDSAARVLAVVSAASKVSETTVRDCAMIPLREARFILAELQKLSLVETQEMPRNATKGPLSKDPHLWSIDLARAYTYLLSSVYKTLGNIIYRKQTEVDSKKVVLARERAAGGPTARDRMADKDKDDLRLLDEALRKLTLGEGRSEQVVFILRDLPGWPGR